MCRTGKSRRQFIFTYIPGVLYWRYTSSQDVSTLTHSQIIKSLNSPSCSPEMQKAAGSGGYLNIWLQHVWFVVYSIVYLFSFHQLQLLWRVSLCFSRYRSRYNILHRKPSSCSSVPGKNTLWNTLAQQRQKIFCRHLCICYCSAVSYQRKTYKLERTNQYSSSVGAITHWTLSSLLILSHLI